MHTNEKEKGKEETTILDQRQVRIIIPICCRENWPTCQHVPKRQRAVKNNIGL